MFANTANTLVQSGGLLSVLLFETSNKTHKTCAVMTCREPVTPHWGGLERANDSRICGPRTGVQVDFLQKCDNLCLKVLTFLLVCLDAGASCLNESRLDSMIRHAPSKSPLRMALLHFWQHRAWSLRMSASVGSTSCPAVLSSSCSPISKWGEIMNGIASLNALFE
jgi:hypothetical protein